MKKVSQHIYVRTLTENDAESLLTLELENRSYFPGIYTFDQR